MTRPALRRALLERYPWLASVEYGPASVTAGECDRCLAEARLVAPCGPPPPDLARRPGPDWALGRRCTLELGEAVWCGGHELEAEQARAWLARLPAEADAVARLWWVATGEIGVDAALLDAARRLELPAPEQVSAVRARGIHAGEVRTMAKDHGPSVKDDRQYERLREQGESKQKAARIANAGRASAGRRGGSSPPYEDWSVDQLRARAAEVGISGRSSMNKGELIDALRNH